jgi:hypothetical protein
MTAVVTPVKIPTVAFTSQVPIGASAPGVVVKFPPRSILVNSQMPIGNGSSPVSPVRSSGGSGGGTYGFSF